MSADAKAGITKDYVGFDIGGSLVSGNASIKIPIPLTNAKLEIGGSGYIGGIGIKSELDMENKKIKVKAIAIVGAGAEMGLG